MRLKNKSSHRNGIKIDDKEPPRPPAVPDLSGVLVFRQETEGVTFESLF